MGGSAIRLGKQRDCDVTGVTISSVQRHWASISARLNRRHLQTRFLTADAESIQFEPRSFDVMSLFGYFQWHPLTMLLLAAALVGDLVVLPALLLSPLGKLSISGPETIERIQIIQNQTNDLW